MEFQHPIWAKGRLHHFIRRGSKSRFVFLLLRMLTVLKNASYSTELTQTSTFRCPSSFMNKMRSTFRASKSRPHFRHILRNHPHSVLLFVSNRRIFKAFPLMNRQWRAIGFARAGAQNCIPPSHDSDRGNCIEM